MAGQVDLELYDACGGNVGATASRPEPRVCFHEAGHFVVGLLFGLTVDHVRADGASGAVILAGPVPEKGDWGLLITIRAGRFAESILTRFLHRPTIEDIEDEMLDERRRGLIGRLDLGKIIRELIVLHPTEDDAFLVAYRALELETIEILARSDVRAAIRAVASALGIAGQLDGATATEIASRFIEPGSLRLEKKS
jgi:hypothetical protein